MKNLNKYLALLMVLVIANFSNTYSQTAADSVSITVKSTGQLRIFNGGKLKLNADHGKFRTTGSGSVVSNQGEIQLNGTNNLFTYNANEVCDDDLANPDDESLALGSSVTNRVPGLVSYSSASTTDAQNIQARFYEDLTMANVSDKSIPDAVFVSGEYLAPGTGSRTYDGTFTYDGTDGQTILGETAGASGAYNDVVFQNAGVKTLAGGTSADMQNLTIDASSGNVNINGDMSVALALTQPSANTMAIDSGSVTLGSGASTLAGTVNIGGPDALNSGSLTQDGSTGTLAIDGTVNVNAFGGFNLTDGSATIGADGTLALANASTATISVAADKTLTVTGSMTNANAAGDNTDFAVTSTVLYNGIAGQKVMGTTAADPYGNLSIASAGSKTVETGDSVVAAGNFSLADANFDLGECVPGQFLWLTDPTKTVTYGTGESEFEVAGTFRRTISGNSTDLTFNNYATKVQIDNATNVNWIELCVMPGKENYVSNYDADRHLKRLIKYNYDVISSSTDWAAAISYGYKPTELETAMQDEAFQKSLRFRETNSDGTLDEKVSTTVAITRDIDANNAKPFNFARLASIRPTGGAVAPQTALAEVADNNLLFLRGGPAEFISVAEGRWSNPATWDEGEQPGPLDVARIRTNVHIGFNRPSVDGNQPEEEVALIQKNIGGYLDRSNLIAKIIIEEVDTESPNLLPTLIVGSDNVNDPVVGITKDVASLIPDSGTILITNVAGASLLADQAAFDAKQLEIEGTTPIASQNLGLMILTEGKLLARNNICVEGAFNGAGEVNVGEED